MICASGQQICATREVSHIISTPATSHMLVSFPIKDPAPQEGSKTRPPLMPMNLLRHWTTISVVKTDRYPIQRQSILLHLCKHHSWIQFHLAWCLNFSFLISVLPCHCSVLFSLFPVHQNNMSCPSFLSGATSQMRELPLIINSSFYRLSIGFTSTEPMRGSISACTTPLMGRLFLKTMTRSRTVNKKGSFLWNARLIATKVFRYE
jgi:hypothetical protein